MGRGGKNDIEEVKSRLDIVDLVGRYVELRPVGGRFMGVCPFHHETKPSFSVNPDMGLYHCFGCQASGDVLDFFCRINGLEFREGLEQLAREVGVELSSMPSSSSGAGKLRRNCQEMHSLAQEYFRKSLGMGGADKARSYIEARGIDPELVSFFGLGWSPDVWQGLTGYLDRRGYSPELGVKAGLLSQSKKGRVYDRFRGRITFPIQNVAGQVIAFGGRIIDEGEPKYLNSSESPVFKKGENLYGLYQARQAIARDKTILVTEGYLDVIALHQHGFENSCGVLGTALTRAQVKRMAGFASRVVLIFDGDRAGRQAGLRSAEMILSYGLECRVVQLPEGEDVDSLLKKEGSASVEKCVEKSMEGLDFCMQMLSSSSPREITAWAEEFLSHCQDSTLKGYFIPRLASGFGISEKEIRQSFAGSGGTATAPKQGNKKGVARRSVGPAQRDKDLLAFAIRHPEYISELDTRGFPQALGTERGRLLWHKLVSHSSEALFLHLDEGEKNFFVRAQMAAMEEDPEQVCREIFLFLKRAGIRRAQQDIRNRLKRAQQAGDKGEVMRLLAQLSTEERKYMNISGSSGGMDE